MSTTMTPQVRFRTIGGVRIRYADSGGSRGPTVVLTSPWPESVYAFAPMWAVLAEHAASSRWTCLGSAIRPNPYGRPTIPRSSPAQWST